MGLRVVMVLVVVGTLLFYFTHDEPLTVVAALSVGQSVGMGLVLCGVVGLSHYIGRVMAERHYRRAITDAPGAYVDLLEDLIEAAIEGGPERASVNARAIVKVRDDLSLTLAALGNALNGEIDRLKEQIQYDVPNQDVQAIQETIDVVWKAWPATGRQVQQGVEQLLIELGLLPVNR